MALEILHRTLMLFGRATRFEGAEITTSASFRIHFAGIQPVFARSQFADHGICLAEQHLQPITDAGERSPEDSTIDPKRFQAKWIAVRVKKTRQNKKLEPGSDSIRTERL
jgi:hypothetical protein